MGLAGLYGLCTLNLGSCPAFDMCDRNTVTLHDA